VNLFAAIFFPLLTVVALCYAAATQPESARCPPGTILLTGIRRSGSFTAWTPGRGVEARTKKGTLVERVSEPPAPVVKSRIYCTGGTQPVVRADGVTVSALTHTDRT
jgi:hypothetical protein